MTEEHRRIIAALKKIDGVRDIELTPYGEVVWVTSDLLHPWLAKTWLDFCMIMGKLAEYDMLQLSHQP